ncbi:CPBP family intramembrane metalloprotease [Lactobacillus sp. CBA3606]|uniref:CPBP family intramembrane glutamic endopeptidase n=1 Tax=Lactobacillus sp. CBA3606 TaxID=2099789 RepID=UPI000CFDB709|nr:type II CAAX endopeptidase family protein [Lactobacillus sp. CBA3606]AVK62813.1 CPBP family intramembrane metalloprotease [Lactobacillus sp. CBA3606]
MQVVDRGLSWLWRVIIMVGLIVGVTVPPMLLRLINTLNQQSGTDIWQLVLIVLYFLVYLGVISLATVVYRHYSGTYRLKRLHHEDVGFVFGGYLAIILSEGLLQMINVLVYQQTQTQNNNAIKTLMSGSSIAMWLMAIGAVFLTPIMEELVFRGALTNLFFKQEWLKIGLSGLVFGSLHSSSTIPSFLMYVMMGLVLASVYRLSGKIQNSIIIHFLINAGAMALMLGSLLL